MTEGCIDSKLSKLHKEVQTQHQWRFEAVEISQFFPLGCKTTFRAYCSDRVTEFVQKPKQQCVTDVGKILGLEAVAVSVRWYPTKDCDSNRRGVEGIYLLKSLPDWNFREQHLLKPAPFEVAEVAEEIQATLREVQTHFHAVNDLATVCSWRQWVAAFAPRTNDTPMSYAVRLYNLRHYKMPMRNIVFDRSQRLADNRWRIEPARSNLNDGIPWNDLVQGYAMNSVRTEHNPNPPPPRVYIIPNAELQGRLALFTEKVDSYYNVRVKGLTMPFIKEMVQSKVLLDGRNVSASGKLILCSLDDLSLTIRILIIAF